LKIGSATIQEAIRKAAKTGDGPTIPDVLYHYTTFDVWNMLVSGSADLCCTDFHELNDRKEYRYGLECVGNVVTKKYTEPSEDAADLSSRFDALRRILRKLDFFSVWSPWVFSLTTEQDSLHQWVAYTDRKEGGVAIGLKCDLIQKQLLAFDDPSKGLITCVLAPCLYVDREFRFWIGENEVDVGILFESIADLVGGDDGLKCAILLLSALVKQKPFQVENEWRVVLQYDNDALKNASLVGGKLRIPFIRHGTKGLYELITEVIVAPHASKVAYKHNVLFPKSQNDALKYKIRSSKLSYV